MTECFQGNSRENLHDPRVEAIEQQATMLEMMAAQVDAPWYVSVPMKALVMGLRQWAKNPDHNSKTTRPAPTPIDSAKSKSNEAPLLDATTQAPPAAPEPAAALVTASAEPAPAPALEPAPIETNWSQLTLGV